MSTDRELLELAAKAAGLRIVDFMSGDDELFAMIDDSWGASCEGLWNPLTDDGDALRLAAKLRINVSFSLDASDPSKEVPSNADMGAAMASIARRAIVRAAAEIGRAMP